MLVYVSRSEWGSSTSTETFIKDRFKATAAEKTTIQVHHTASIDGNDSTPNRWTKDEAVTYMRSLQWARPELGPLPYSFNLAASEDTKTVWVFEGRGALTVGAHTAGHNRDGVGLGVFGNFDTKDEDAAAALVDAIQTVCADLKNGTSVMSWLKPELPNLGTVPNPNGWVAWGHRDSSPKSCPGNTLYPLLESFTLEDDMPLSDEDVQKVALAVANVKVSRNGVPVSWIQETADAKTMLLLQQQDANHLTDAELDSAVNNLINTLPQKVLDLLKAKL